MSEKAERQLSRYINSLRSENKISESEMDWTQWNWEKFKQIAESLFDALKSVEERQQSLTDRQIISDLVKNFTGELKDLSFGVYGTEMKHTLKFIERYESVLVKKPIKERLKEMGEKNVIVQVFSELTKASKFSERCASLLRFLLEHDTKANEILALRDRAEGRRQDTPSPSSGVQVPSKEQVTKTWDHLLNRISDWACNIIKAAKIVMEAEVLKVDAKAIKDSVKESKKRKAGDGSVVVSEKKSKTGNPKNSKLDCQICGGQHYPDKTGNVKTC